MRNSINTMNITKKLAEEINEQAKQYAQNNLRAFEAIARLLWDKRVYHDTTDQLGNAEDAFGNHWKRHSLYSGWLTKSKKKQDWRIADGVFTETLVDAVLEYDIEKGAEFVTFFCDKLHYKMKTHFENLREYNKEIECSLDDYADGDSELRIGDLIEDKTTAQAFSEFSIAPHKMILLGRGLIKNLQIYATKKSKKSLSTEQDYFKTFYTLDTCSIIRALTENRYKSITNYEHEVVEAVDYEIMHGLYINPCTTFMQVVLAEDKYPEHVYSEDKGVEKPGMYHDIVITFIKKTRNETPISKEQVSKYRGKYSSIIDVIEFA